MSENRSRRLPSGFGPMAMLIALTVVTTTVGIYLVYSQYQVVRMGYVIDQDLFEYRREMEIRKRLQLSIASFKHPQTVPEFAKTHLNMRPPTLNQEFVIPKVKPRKRSAPLKVLQKEGQKPPDDTPPTPGGTP